MARSTAEGEANQMRKAALSLTVAMMLLVQAGPALAATPQKFRDTSNNEWTVAVEGGYAAWAVDRPSARYTYTIMVKPPGHPAYALNPDGTSAELGNIELGGPHGNVLVYQVVQLSSHGNWNIGFWNLATRRKMFVPKAVNTAMAERFPSISGDHLLFTRSPATRYGFGRSVVLYTFSTHTMKVLATAPSGGQTVAGRVAGDFATYTVCQGNGSCSVFRYQISTGTTKQLPNGGPGRAAYFSTVASDGTVYYAQGSATSCGVHTQLRSWSAGSSRTLFQLSKGIEVGPTYVSGPPASRSLFFTRIRCGQPLHYGIWRLKL